MRIDPYGEGPFEDNYNDEPDENPFKDEEPVNFIAENDVTRASSFNSPPKNNIQTEDIPMHELLKRKREAVTDVRRIGGLLHPITDICVVFDNEEGQI